MARPSEVAIIVSHHKNDQLVHSYLPIPVKRGSLVAFLNAVTVAETHRLIKQITVIAC